MRKLFTALAVLLLAAGLATPAGADSSFGLGFSSTAASGPQCASVNAGTTTLEGFSMGNLTTTAAILTFYDSTLALTSTAAKSYPFVIPAASTANQGAGSNVLAPFPLNFVTALSFCINTASGTNANSSALLQGTIFYH